MDLEKLKQAKQLIEDCISEYDNEGSGEQEDSSQDSTEDSNESSGMGGDKVKMAIALMKRKS